MAHGVDLVGRDVELVVAAVLEQQVVALDAVDGALHHPAEPGDTVLVMHDVVAGREVVEELRGVGAAAGARWAVGAATTGEVGFGEHRELDRRKDEAPLEGRDLEFGLEAVLVEQPANARRRPFVVRADHDAVALLAQVGQLAHEAVAVADDGIPAHRLDRGDARPFRRDRHRPCGRVGVREQTIERHVQARELGGAGGVGAPRLRQRAGEVGFLGEDVGGAVAESFGLDEDDLRVARQEVEQHVLAVDEPRQPRLHAVERQPVGQPLPLLATPRLAGDEPVGALAHLVGGQQLATREHHDALERVRRPLVADRELAETIDLVAPEVDAHGRVRGRREDVDDRAAHRDLAAMLDLILAAVARLHERG